MDCQLIDDFIIKVFRKDMIMKYKGKCRYRRIVKILWRSIFNGCYDHIYGVRNLSWLRLVRKDVLLYEISRMVQRIGETKT